MRVLNHLHRLDVRDLPRWERVAVRTIQFVQATWSQFRRDKVIIRASGLAYSSLLAAVPLVAVAFAIFSAFGAFDDVKQKVQEFLFTQFLPTSQDEIAPVLQPVRRGRQQARADRLSVPRPRRRSCCSTTSNPTSTTSGTSPPGASSSPRSLPTPRCWSSARSSSAPASPFGPDQGERFSGHATSTRGRWRSSVPGSSRCSDVSRVLAHVPGDPFTRVRLKSALLGAAIGSVLWELGKNLFANWVGQSVRYSTIYGSLAVIPIFLVWLYITWIIVLLGLEISFTHQHFAALVRIRSSGDGTSAIGCRPGSRSNVDRQRFHGGNDPPTADELSRRFWSRPDGGRPRRSARGGRDSRDGWRSVQATEASCRRVLWRRCE